MYSRYNFEQKKNLYNMRTTRMSNGIEFLFAQQKHNIHKMKINVDGACSRNITISRIK